MTTTEWVPPDQRTYPIIDPSAPCGWCGSSERPRIQRGPSLKGWQCADPDACREDWRRWWATIERRAEGATPRRIADVHARALR